MGFSYAARLSDLAYDFTEAPRDDGEEGFCTGKGRVPEPSRARIKAFESEMDDLRKEAIATAKSANEQPETEAPIDFEQLGEEWIGRTISAAAALCADSPSEEALRQLPLGVLALFCTWLRDEVLSPKG